jgi:hypothetical protein
VNVLLSLNSLICAALRVSFKHFECSITVIAVVLDVKKILVYFKFQLYAQHSVRIERHSLNYLNIYIYIKELKNLNLRMMMNDDECVESKEFEHSNGSSKTVTMLSFAHTSL